MLEGKKILLGVCASIAAYKAAFLTRLFVKAGAEVRIVMTPQASAFIGEVTLSALSKNPVYSAFINESENTWNNHVEMGLWADVLLVAPATANTISKFAHAACDNLLCAVYLSARCPVFIAPAMDLDMLKHPAMKNNLQLLESYGNRIIKPGDGELASGLLGEGRLAEPEDIFQTLAQYVSSLNK